ncbi:alpha/beta fold hydrolase [Nonomuraea sp. NPDC050328]|uniref:alpha/beta fold hydrolase n=1 Tax=Nonomuraea sp. NPDC050328 TaxID=3364361 RepID=UPI003789E478
MQENDYLSGVERLVPAGDLTLWAEGFGDPRDPAILLVMGAGAQGVQWNDGLIARLAAAGHHVIRYDHRDTGRSSTVDFATSPYTVADVASDALAVLDAFAVERAHLVGVSLGGLLVQHLARTHPHRVRTQTVISSTPLGADTGAAVERALAGLEPLPGMLPPPSLAVLSALAASLPPAGASAADYLAARRPLWRVLHGGVLPFPEEEYGRLEARVHARARDLSAAVNHSLAGAAGFDAMGGAGGGAGDRPPALVIHGSEDPMFPPEHGRAVADALPGATLVMVDGMGHTLPACLDGLLAEAVLDHVGRPANAG